MTAILTYKATHVSISVSIGDMLEREPTHICDASKKELIKKFMEEMERHGKNIRKVVTAEFLSVDIYLIPGKQKNALSK